MKLSFLKRMINDSLALHGKNSSVLRATNNLSLFTVVPEGFEFRFVVMQTQNNLESFFVKVYCDHCMYLQQHSSVITNFIFKDLMESVFSAANFNFSYLMTIAVVSVIALIPYAVFFLFTCYCKALLQPKASSNTSLCIENISFQFIRQAVDL